MPHSTKEEDLPDAVAVQRLVELIRNNIDCLKKQSASCAHIIGAEKSRKAHEFQSKLADDTKQALRQLAERLQFTEDKIAKLEDGVERRMLAIQASTIKRKMAEASAELTETINESQERRRKALKYQIQINNPSLEIPDDVPVEQLQHEVFKQTLTKQHLIELKEREDQIVQLQKSLAELRDMFQAFTEALSLQEECIQTIEDTLQKTKTSVIATNLELKKALRLRNKARKKVAAIIALFGAAAAAALASMGVKMGALAAI